MIFRTLSEICKVGSVKPMGFRILQGSVGKWWCEEVLRWEGNHQLGLRPPPILINSIFMFYVLGFWIKNEELILQLN